jgi:hypothetical protein
VGRIIKATELSEVQIMAQKIIHLHGNIVTRDKLI